MDEPRTAERRATRRMWHLLEPIHALTYFSPEVVEACTARGLKGFWHTYFAARVAPMGPVGPEVCAASFFGFAPGAVARALPSAWAVTTPAEVIAARDRAVRTVLADLLTTRTRRRPVARVVAPAGTLRALRSIPRGGRLIADSLAVRPPPAAAFGN